MTDAHTRHQLSILVVLWLGGFFLVNSFFGITIALPEIQRDFGTQFSDLQWLSIMGWVTMAALSLPFSRLADRLGRRRFYTGGLVLYAVGSGLTGVANNFEVMLIFRAVMSIGLAIAMPLGPAIAAAAFPERRGWALGIVASSMAMGRAMGPILGGAVIEPWGWRAIFLSNLAFGAVAAIAAFLLIRNIVEERRSEPFDLKGTIALLIAFPCLLIPITRGPQDGWSAPHQLVLFTIAAVGAAAFIMAEAKARSPLIPLGYFKNLSFSAAVGALSISSLATFPVIVFVPLYLKASFNLSPLEIGLWMTPLAVSTAVFSTVGGRWSDQMDPRSISFWGLVLGVLGLALYAMLEADSAYVMIAGAMILLGISGGLFTPANQKAAFVGASGAQLGMISAVLASLNMAAGAIGTSIAVAVHESRMGEGVSFAEGQQVTFMIFVPIMVIAASIALLGRPPKTIPASEAPAKAPA